MAKQSPTNNVAEYVSRKMPDVMEKIQHKIGIASREGETRIEFSIGNEAVKNTITELLEQQGFLVKIYSNCIIIKWSCPTGEEVAQCDKSREHCCQCSKPFLVPHKERKKFILRSIIYLVLFILWMMTLGWVPVPGDIFSPQTVIFP